MALLHYVGLLNGLSSTQVNYYLRVNYYLANYGESIVTSHRMVAFAGMESSADRARLLIKQIGPKKLSVLSGTDHSRWLNVSKGAVRVSSEEIDVLVQLYPQYALWLASGEIIPEKGQTSPAHDAQAADPAE